MAREWPAQTGRTSLGQRPDDRHHPPMPNESRPLPAIASSPVVQDKNAAAAGASAASPVRAAAAAAGSTALECRIL
jgi:hypothetical protein